MGINKQIPMGLDRLSFIETWLQVLSERLRDTRVICGDWSGVTGPSVTHRLGLTGMFLDPPYSKEAGRDDHLYRTDDNFVAHKAKEWAVEAGNNPEMRIIFCGYSDEHEFPKDWMKVSYSAAGGFGNQRKESKNTNKHKETLWCSPHCLR